MNITELKKGSQDAISIGIGYFAVSFTLGIAMKQAGIPALHGFWMSFLNLASAGEYAGIQVIQTSGTYLEMALVTLVANARYFLMSCSFSQRFSFDTPQKEKLLCGYALTDELFALSLQQAYPLSTSYYFGAMLVTVLPWSFGSMLGIMTGSILPARLLSAFSTALYGMFLAILLPAFKKDRTLKVLIPLSFACSFLLSYFPVISSSFRTILLTLVLSALAAYFRPIEEDIDDEH